MTGSLISSLTSDVEIKYAILPADTQYNLPEQIEILGVYITVTTKKGAQRKVDILGSLGESALMALEDEISEEKNMYLYVNDELISQRRGPKENVPFEIKEHLKTHDSIKPFLLGFCSHTNTRFKGKISDLKIYNKFFNNINDVYTNTENIILDVDMNSENIIKQNVDLSIEDIEIIENIIPYRREGKFYCLPHVDEGFINGRWAKGETTARNEKRFVTEMQQGKINYKEDGLKNVLETMEIVNIDDSLYTNTKFINVKMK